MSMSMLIFIFLFGSINAIIALGGVALGGILVYKTKREPHEAFFAKPQKPSSAVAPDDFGGEATQASEWGTDEEDENEEQEMDFGADVMQYNQRFLDQQGEHPAFFQAPQSEEQK